MTYLKTQSKVYETKCSIKLHYIIFSFLFLLSFMPIIIEMMVVRKILLRPYEDETLRGTRLKKRIHPFFPQLDDSHFPFDNGT